MNESLRRYGSTRSGRRSRAAYSGSSRSSRAIDSSSSCETGDEASGSTRSPRRARAPPPGSAQRELRARGRAPPRSSRRRPPGCRPGRRRSRCRSEKRRRRVRERGAGTPRAARSAASSRLSSKNQRPWRISSITRGRSPRTSSVCQRSVISSASAASIASRSRGASSGSSSAVEQRPRCARALRATCAASPRSGAR